MQIHSTAMDLQDAHYSAIGQVLVQWAQLEYRLHEIVWRAIGIDNKQGRTLTVGASFRALAGIIGTVKLRWKTTSRQFQQMSSILKHAARLYPERNYLAHGSWQHPQGEPGNVYLHYMREGADRLLPKAKKREPSELKSVAAKIRALNVKAQALIDYLEKQQRTSPSISFSHDLRGHSTQNGNRQ